MKHEGEPPASGLPFPTCMGRFFVLPRCLHVTSIRIPTEQPRPHGRNHDDLYEFRKDRPAHDHIRLKLLDAHPSTLPLNGDPLKAQRALW
jgi:hypothetical protein